MAASLRGSPGIALGDVVGANVAIYLVALGVGGLDRAAAVPGRGDALRSARLPLGAVTAWFVWDGEVGRAEGAVLVALYVAYVGAIWWMERKPSALGEVGELAEARDAAGSGRPARVGRDLALVLAGVAAMAGGATLLVEAVQRISGVEATQTRLGLTLVGFATGFELVVLAWSAARRGISEAVVSGVVGSFAYNATMTLGAGALARPMVLADVALLHVPVLLMLASLALVVVLAARRGQLGRPESVVLLAAYPVFVVWVLLA